MADTRDPTIRVITDRTTHTTGRTITVRRLVYRSGSGGTARLDGMAHTDIRTTGTDTATPTRIRSPIHILIPPTLTTAARRGSRFSRDRPKCSSTATSLAPWTTSTAGHSA